jgi:hypothetical protein
MKYLIGFLFLLSSTFALADYRMIVPDSPGSGGAVWASVMAKHLSKYTDEPIVLQHVPGARNIPGMNQWHKEFRKDDKTMVVSLGSHAVNYLLEEVDYDFSQYDAIGLMNLDLVVGHNKNFNPKTDKAKFGGGNAMTDALAVGLMLCGPKSDTNAYLACWKEKMIWVNGVAGNQIRPMYLRGELNITRDPPTSWIRFYENDANTVVWFTHGLRDLKTGKQIENPNFKGKLFEDVYKATWGVAPSGELYESYHMARTFNNVLQKVIWVNKGNPNTQKLRDALNKMLKDPEAIAAIVEDTGKYDWVVGDNADKMRKSLYRDITDKKLKNLVVWYNGAYGTKSVFKGDLAWKNDAGN